MEYSLQYQLVTETETANDKIKNHPQRWLKTHKNSVFLLTSLNTYSGR